MPSDPSQLTSATAPLAASSPAVSSPVVRSPVIVIEAKPGWKLIDWHECLEYRDLLYFLVLRDVTVLYKQTILGFAWAILNPFFSMVVFTVIFGMLLKVPSDGQPYALFSFAALLPWTYFSQSLTGATGSLIAGTNLFTKVYFPRLFIPLVPVFSKLVDFAIAFVFLIFLMVWYRVAPSRNIMFLPLLMLLMMLTAAGIGMFLSALAIQYRDIRHAMTFVMQILMYAAPGRLARLETPARPPPLVWPLSDGRRDRRLSCFSLEYRSHAVGLDRHGRRSLPLSPSWSAPSISGVPNASSRMWRKQSRKQKAESRNEWPLATGIPIPHQALCCSDDPPLRQTSKDAGGSASARKTTAAFWDVCCGPCSAREIQCTTFTSCNPRWTAGSTPAALATYASACSSTTMAKSRQPNPAPHST